MRILQMSDIHLAADKNDDLFGVNVYQAFNTVMEFIGKNQKKLNIDAVVVTGDISRDGSSEAYQYFYHAMERLALPYFALAGDLDNKTRMSKQALAAKNFHSLDQISSDKWAFLDINSLVRNEDFGFIDNSELAELKSKIIKNSGKEIAIFLHHPPLPVGTPIVDICNLINGDTLLKLCDDYAVRYIGCGHARSASIIKRNNIFISVSPAICFQWINGTHHAANIKSSGFNIISFSDNLYIETYFI
ncbi:MAG: metallophosphoesterase [Rouxiella aceris]|uniref:metallophosphoesterase n=1 Tax=Rouxiella aceris TaxID=2703884 RepID=UPI00284D12CE|nr:metallophosphoesterase [Rouxiella aceris]MDR3431107.1 metallophosphoesterase [Rouxiella aceris]